MEPVQPFASGATSSAVARIYRLNLRLSTETLGEAASALEAMELDAKEFFVLDGIEERPYPMELSRHLSIPKPTMSMYIRALERKGLIGRSLDSADLRRHRLELTSAGKDALQQARTHLFSSYGARLDRLSQREQFQLEKLLAKIVG